jgi:hypothetical protein
LRLAQQRDRDVVGDETGANLCYRNRPGVRTGGQASELRAASSVTEQEQGPALEQVPIPVPVPIPVLVPVPMPGLVLVLVPVLIPVLVPVLVPVLGRLQAWRRRRRAVRAEGSSSPRCQRYDDQRGFQHRSQ